MTQIVESWESIQSLPDTESPQTEVHPVVVAGADMLDTLLNGGEIESLDEGRQVIDMIDASILAAMAARIHATERLSIYKAEQGLPGVDLARERVIFRETGTAALALGLEPSAVNGVFLALINKARQQHSAARTPVRSE